ncbi:NACHT domain-containing protein [Mucilaginibacter sp. Bleaf8]|uniref:NACHT domain-containing protein n=1 Tax=Mucilaginibacter sp. Bleaf8 TaxID=2834430 RepID=UPI001BD099F3|nr:NACHT domain-containing protein [Mucilaginibacter sp. Bleaf8]MBS7563876.1 NACHT domain-containing protein [Mucilaginibacter sp. Bleaf8]
MRIISQQDLDLLKDAVLTAANLKANTPAVFKELSLLIADKTKKQVSNSTLKRIFGFAAYTFQPSLYTLNVLAEFAGHESWTSFLNQHKQQQLPAAPAIPPRDMNTLQQRALETSKRTLQALKSKSGIQFPLTIPRDVLREHLEIFTHSPCIGTVLAAPAGYGKTIALCHWVDEQIQLNQQQNNPDIILFISSRMLSAANQQGNLYHWLLSLSGASTASEVEHDAIKAHLARYKFHLVIDALDLTSLPPDQLETVQHLLLDIIAVYQESVNFKIIVTMRSATWINFRRQLQAENKLEHWYTGFMSEENPDRNLPLLTASEIVQLGNKIKPGLKMTYELHQDIFQLFSYPPFFQYYYQQNSKDFVLDELNVFDTYEVIHSYIVDKIYTGRYSTEKVLLLQVIIEQGRFRDNRFCTNILAVYPGIKELNNGYQELISTGIIREINLSSSTGYTECIEFVHERILTYFTATKLIAENRDRFNGELIDKISNTFNDRLRLQVLKWCIFIALKNNEPIIFSYLPRIQLIASEKATLIMFLAKLADQGILSDTEDGGGLPFDISNPELFQYFFGIEFLSSDYEIALQSLLKLKLQDASKIWIYTCTAIIHVISLNAPGVETCINELKKFPANAYLHFQINPLNCLETLYHFLKFKVVKKEAIAEITRFIFHPVLKRHQLNKLSSNHILYMLALGTLMISANPAKMLRFISVLHRVHHNNQQFLPQFHLGLLISKTHFLLDLGRQQEALSIFELIMLDYKDDRNKFTPYMKSLLDLLAARLIPYSADNNYIDASVKALTQPNTDNTYKLLQVNALSYYLTNRYKDRMSADYKTLYFKFIKLMRSSAFNPKSFLMNYDQIKELNMDSGSQTETASTFPSA